MRDSVLKNLYWKVVSADALVLFVLGVIWLNAKSSSGDQSIALGAIFLVSFIFVCTPLLVVVLVFALEKLKSQGCKRNKLAIAYLVLSFSLHGLLAYDAGFFDQWIDNYQRQQYDQANPAQTKLRHAMSSGPIPNINQVKSALEAGADPNGWSSQAEKVPLLLVAAMWADPASIEALLDAGADPQLRAKTDFDSLSNPSALDLLVFSENVGTMASIELLLANGATAKGSMLLSGACWRGDWSLFQRAKKLGASFETDSVGDNCFHFIAEENKIEFFDLLVATHAPPKISWQQMLATTNRDQETPLDTAISHKHFDLALKILQAGGVSRSPHIQAFIKRLPASPEVDAIRLQLEQVSN